MSNVGFKYKTLEAHLRRLVVERRPGDKIPSESDLAKQLGCSHGTVRKAISTLVYEGLLTPRQGAGVFVQERPRLKSFGIVVPNIFNPDHALLANTFTKVAAEKGYTSVLGVVADEPNDSGSPKREQEFVERLIQMRVSGVIKTPVWVEEEPAMRARLRAAGIPYVIVNDFWTDCYGDHHIAVDERMAARMAVEHLARLGHTRIAFMLPGGDPRPGAEDAFRQAVRAHGLADSDCVVAGGVSKTTAWLRSKLSKSHRVTAIVTPYHPWAMVLLSLIESLGLQVPRDVSLVSFSSPIARGDDERDVTTLITPVNDVVQQALTILTEGARAASCHFLYAPTLHIGDTTAPPEKTPGPVERNGEP